ncbi:MAG TPA: glycosyltransferase family 9 protein, partial [Armatimonadota bacterium]|nr:glycosyltransferase family 9 protein [Armatimonadota bacterium]
KLWMTGEERAEGAAALAESGIRAGERVIALHPGVHDAATRAWREERFAELGTRLAAEIGARILILGSREEAEIAGRVAGAMRGSPVVFAGRTGLRQTMALISNSSLWIGSDGGMLHTAVGLAPATVGIFGPTKDVRWGYHTPNHRTVVRHPEQGPCDAGVIRQCLDAIIVEDVFQASVAALEASTVSSGAG